MRIGIVFTDLDGTLLELDGQVCAEAQDSLKRLDESSVPVCAVTSKTVEGITPLLMRLGVSSPAAFENGAGILFPGGFTQLFDRAVPAWVLNHIAKDIRTKTQAPLRTVWELNDEELACLTGLPPAALAAVRKRQATAPLLVDEKWDQALSDALPNERSLALIRGNRFLHLHRAFMTKELRSVVC